MKRVTAVLLILLLCGCAAVTHLAEKVSEAREFGQKMVLGIVSQGVVYEVGRPVG